MQDDIQDRVIAELVAMPGLLVDPDELRPELRLREDLGLESVTLIQLIVALEDEFGFRVDPITMDLHQAFESVASLVAFVRDECGQ
jgi:acyl carrier protein